MTRIVLRSTGIVESGAELFELVHLDKVIGQGTKPQMLAQASIRLGGPVVETKDPPDAFLTLRVAPRGEGDETATLKARVRELEQENDRLRRALELGEADQLARDRGW